jgi:DNA-binding transcriptional LysR family regulator
MPARDKTVMELRHVRTFLVLAEELHFGRTAARLHVAQSAVSQTLKALEQEVGAMLFARTRRRVSLTPAGEHFRSYAREALASLERAATAARRAATGETGRLVLRFTRFSALSVIPAAVVRFRQECPGVQLHIEPGSTSEQLEALRAGRCDIGFVAYTEDAAPFSCEQVTHEHLVALLPRGHALASRRALRFEQLATEPMLVLSRHAEPAIHARHIRAYHEAGVVPPVVAEVDGAETLLAFVAAGLGVAHAPSSVSRLKMEGVVAIPITPRSPVGVTAVWDAASLSPPARRFLELLRSARASARHVRA